MKIAFLKGTTILGVFLYLKLEGQSSSEKLYYIGTWTMDEVKRKLHTVTLLRPCKVELCVSLH